MRLQVLLRQVHHWLAIAVALPLLVMIGAGLLLMLKKDVGWIQPPTTRGVVADAAPTAAFAALFAAAQSVPEAKIGHWTDLDRVDFATDKGVVKFVSKSRWEVQVDTATAEVLQVAYRRSDLIESIHDGSFFAGWTKHFLFLPSGVALFVLWLTGIYLFFLPHAKRWARRSAKAAPPAPSINTTSRTPSSAPSGSTNPTPVS